MNKNFYPRLALNSIRKNKKLYVPYILTCIGMVMMYYIVAFLAVSPFLKNTPGGDFMQEMLSLGGGIIGVFSLIFLFYTNSFLIRRRQKEFGLYNILGMGKKNLAKVILWESVITSLVSLFGGLFGGIVFSKLAELIMIKILKGESSFTLNIEWLAVRDAAHFFLIIFLLIMLYTMLKVRVSKPIDLLRSENKGEKPPKANWFLAVLGVAVLGFAYYIAVSIKDPVTAMMWFFAAVIMVIVGTYLLFVSGSVALCRLLQKNKKYYYKTNHFVSVSSMAYRMKRNGAGLASICILSTMVLVMLSSTVCLYAGMEDSLNVRYPRDINLETFAGKIEFLESERITEIRETVEQTAEKHGAKADNFMDYRAGSFSGYIENGKIETDFSHFNENYLSNLSGVWQVFIVPLEDYNKAVGKNEALEKGEAIIFTTKSMEYKGETIAIGDSEPLKIKKRAESFVDNGVDAMQIIPTMYIFVPDFEEVTKPVSELKDLAGNPLCSYSWIYSFDLDCGDETQTEIYSEIKNELKKYPERVDGRLFITNSEGKANERAGFYGLYGGLFFLGILLSVVFIFASVLIIYYKQISEGYEDQARFEIMQKVGMNKKEIKKSINSQILTVFFLPLITAGVHLAFAFPIINKLLTLLVFRNLYLLIFVTVCCFLVFALFYVLVYTVTSKAYYSVVSGGNE